MMNIIAASRLRRTLRNNVFFGGVGGVITNESILASNLIDVLTLDIQDFRINDFKDVICFIDTSWGLNAGDFDDKSNLRFIIDLDGNFISGIGNDNLRNANALEFIYAPNCGQLSFLATNAFENSGLMYFPSARTFDNRDRNVGGGGIIFFDSSIENDIGLTLDKLRASTHELIFIQNYNTPSAITSFTVDEVGTAYAKISLTFPSHSNIMRFIEVWRLGSFFTISQDETEIIITGLNPSSNNQIEIFVADQYYNRSIGYKQSILTQATDITITEVNTGGTYVEFSINNTTSFTVTEVEVYANGVLNTISNQYILNLNELTSYNIEVIAKTSEGADLISNTINVTTTTTPALFQNAVAYYKLDETSGNAIDIVNGYNGALFGGVTQGVAGKIGTAYSFDGVDDYVNIGDLNLNVSNAYSFSAWVKGLGQIIGRDDNNKRFWQFRIINNEVNFIRFNSSNDVITNLTGGSVNINEYNHVVLTFSISNGSKIYLNGVEVGSDSNLTQNQTGIGAPILIGATPRNSVTNFFNGSIDEVSIYENYELQIQEISDLYNNGIGTTI